VNPALLGETDLKFSGVLHRYKICPISSSDAKVMIVLLKLLESRFYVDKRCKLIMRRDDGGWRDQHKLKKNTI
jgi:hypothetical protein